MKSRQQIFHLSLYSLQHAITAQEQKVSTLRLFCKIR